jgi:tungstate transport system substrate-binding protein
MAPQLGDKGWTAMMAVIVVAISLILAVVLSIPGGKGEGELVLATTTSTYDSGLLDHIIPVFEKEHDVRVKVVATGTGQALRLGEAGDADVLMVHSPPAEIQFIEGGYGLYRVAVMHNEFVLVGPSKDPADIKGKATAAEALEAIFTSRATFCSRGDDSGTHNKERALWAMTDVPYGTVSSHEHSDWYLSLGQGMGDTLRTASQKGAYTLTDDGTYYALLDELDLEILNVGDAQLMNPYHVIPVNGTMHANVEEELAKAFADWIVTPAVQGMINDYTRDGQTLFTADALQG